jgi:endonuclease YncB( thermonuclease family)
VEANGEAGDSDQVLLKRSRRLRWISITIAGLFVASSIVDHTRVFGYVGNPQQSFDGQQVIVSRVLSGDEMIVHRVGQDEAIPIHLLGVASPHGSAEHWADQSQHYAEARALNHTVTLHLDSIGWRDPRGELQAYAFLTDADNLNLDLIHDGEAYADRRNPHALHATFEAAENEARTKKRGLWRSVTKEQMPAWRQEWMKSRGIGN